MYQNINNEIIRVKGDVRKKKKLEKQRLDYEQELLEIEKTIEQLNEQLIKEKKDVERLERLGITNFMATIFGSKDEKLNKEEQEVAAVQLQLKEALKTKKDITESLKALQQTLKSIMTSEDDLKRLLKEKEQLIKKDQSLYAEQLYNIDEQDADIQSYLKELKEAISAGGYVTAALERAIDSLESAKGWGTWDMIGGGVISTAIKHDHINKAEDNIHIAQHRMRSFQKELLDVDELTNDIDVDMSNLLKFADFFFDGFIVDWMVQGRIKDSLLETENQLKQVNEILIKLESLVETNEKELLEIKSKRKEIIVKYH